MTELVAGAASGPLVGGASTALAAGASTELTAASTVGDGGASIVELELEQAASAHKARRRVGFM
jgi:hypothetical protein